MRNVQHKKEAYWFYRFLSIVYDDYVNPFFWTPRMRDEALALADLSDESLGVVDVGSGTGFTTEGIVRHVRPDGVVCLDQSPHQMERARRKPALQTCTFRLGDAEALPFEADRFDRYVSAGSIEYWPDPQRGVDEAFRVVKPGGRALLIGPLRPKGALARLAADTWMLFPEEEAYRAWFRRAGFTDIRIRYVAPSWVRHEKYGLAISGRKPEQSAEGSPAPRARADLETVDEPMTLSRALTFGRRLAVGSLAGFAFIPAAVVGVTAERVRHRLGLADPDAPPPDPLTGHQKVALGVIGAGLAWLVARALRGGAMKEEHKS